MYNAPYISELDNEHSLSSQQTCSLGRLLCEQRARITFKLNGNKGCISQNFDQRVSDVTDAFKCEIIWNCIWSRICLSTLATEGFWLCYLQGLLSLHTTGFTVAVRKSSYENVTTDLLPIWQHLLWMLIC